jgi:hypothetical protein
VTFAAWTWFLAGCEFPEKRNMRLVAACGALLFLCASNIHGFVAARSVVDQKMIWRGAKIVGLYSITVLWDRYMLLPTIFVKKIARSSGNFRK